MTSPDSVSSAHIEAYNHLKLQSETGSVFFFLLPAGTHTVCINVGRTPKHKINNKTLKSFPKNTKNGEKLLKIFAL